jgi:hypothetical protein
MDWTALKLMLEGIEVGRQRKRYQHAKIFSSEPHNQLAMR